MFLQTLVPWINDVGVDVLSDPQAAETAAPTNPFMLIGISAL